MVPLRDRCSFGRFPWLISQALSVTYMAGERRLYLERNCRLPESPAHSRRRNREGPASSKGLNSQRGFGPAVEPRRKSRPRSTSLHGSSPCKCQRLSTLRWDRLPPSRPSTKSGARAGGRRLSDRRLHRWLAGTSASAPSSHGAAGMCRTMRALVGPIQDFTERSSRQSGARVSPEGDGDDRACAAPSLLAEERNACPLSNSGLASHPMGRGRGTNSSCVDAPRAQPACREAGLTPFTVVSLSMSPEFPPPRVATWRATCLA